MLTQLFPYRYPFQLFLLTNYQLLVQTVARETHRLMLLNFEALSF
jgi:hypothetical protein